MFVSKSNQPLGAAPMLALAALLTLLAAGCSGSSSTQTARMRFINAVPNGGVATFYASGNFYGDESFQGVSEERAVSSATTSFSYTLASYPTTTHTATATIVSPDYYTVIAMGLPNVASTDTRYPQLQVVADSQVAPPTGDIAVRAINAAPDLTSVTVTANAISLIGAAAYPNIGTYTDLATGSLTVSATTTSGTVASATYNGITAGHRYTLLVEETNPSTLIYGLELIDDTTNTVVTH